MSKERLKPGESRTISESDGSVGRITRTEDEEGTILIETDVTPTTEETIQMILDHLKGE